ncbi:hypothetical protein [Terrabacter sp. NPDC000476]|uniref:hypothetical protein n=1 Tax=Terrabacter sp. NPDC000476 TaxID=3154258 RepID=UPI00331EDAF5
MRAYAVRVAAVAGLAALGLGVTAPAASASCAGRSPAQVVADSDVVLAGRLTGVDDPGGAQSPHDVVWTVQVDAVHRGSAPRSAHVLATQYSHEDVTAGGSYVFALDVVGGGLRAGGCQDVAPAGAADAAAMAAAAGPAAAPLDDGSVPGAAVPEVAQRWSWWASPLGMLTIALLGLVGVTVGGLALAVVLGLVVGRRQTSGPRPPHPRRPGGGAGEDNSTGTSFK